MFKKLILIGLLLTGISSLAEEIPVTITPVNKISTTDKSLKVGTILEFKEIETNRPITGILRELSENKLAGVEATVFINNFKYKDTGESLIGELYIKGGEHLKYQEFSNYFGASMFVRGGEVILEPQKTQLTLFVTKGEYKEEVAIPIKPAEKISTCYDELETGDKIKFTAVKDIYKNGKILIKKNSPLLGTIDYINDNGWSYDNAQIDIKEFKVRDINGRILAINSPISINGFEILKYKNNRIAQFFNYCGVIFRGKEIEISPETDNIEYVIWLK